MNDSSLLGTENQDGSELKIQLISYDSYQTAPTSLDKQRFTLNSQPYSGKNVSFTQVPVIRVYGKLTTGHTCLLHLHNVFPYIYVHYQGPMTGEKDIQTYLLSWKDQIDSQLRQSFRWANRKRRKMKEDQPSDRESDQEEDSEEEEDIDIGPTKTFVSDLSIVKGNSLYGYHYGFSPFIKISLLSPRYTKRLARLLTEAKLFDRFIQPFESHVPYMLQFLTDYNCFGCNWIYLEKLFWRSPVVFTGGDVDAYQEYFQTDFTVLNQAKITPELKTELSKHVHREMFSLNVLTSEQYPRMGRSFCELDSSACWLKNRLTCKERDTHSSLEFNLQPDHEDTYIYSIKSLLSDLAYQRSQKGMPAKPKFTLFDGEQRSFEETTWTEQQELDELLKYCTNESEKEWHRLHPRHALTETNVVPKNEWLFKYDTAFRNIDRFHVPSVPESHLVRLTERQILHESQICDWLLEEGLDQVTRSIEDTSNIAIGQTTDSSSDETEHEDDFLGSIPHLEEKLGTQESSTPTASMESSEKLFNEPVSSASADLDARIFGQTQQVRRHSTNISESVVLESDSQSTNPAIRLEASENLFEVTLRPPKFASPEDMMNSFEDHSLMKIDYPDPHYTSRTNYSAAPTFFSGKKFQVKCLDLQGLQPYSTVDELNSNTALVEGPGIKSIWSFQLPAPKFKSVAAWCKSHPKRKKTRSQVYRSQVDLATQNLKGYKFPSFQSPISRKADRFNKLIVLSMEIHINTRGNLFPDPEEDAISAVFWSFDDQNYPFDLGIQGSGILVLSSHDLSRKQIRYPLQTFQDEKEMVAELISLVEFVDPDILCGYETHSSSWGYLLERFNKVHKMDLGVRLSRVATKHHNKRYDRWGYTHASSIQITGRHMLNLWRPLRKELSINRYSLENVVWHTLHIKIPHYDHKTLTRWFISGTPGNLNNFMEYYMSRLHWEMKLIDKLEIVERTVEESKFLGIDYYSVFYRGSQFKVESLLIRLAKAENFMVISPSKKQVFKQSPLQVISLILEPESSFYKSPMLVLDFQSLYPSLVIAHNLCYSTLLGKLNGYDPKKNQTLGITSWKLPPGLLKLFEKHITITPNGLMFLKPSVRKSVLAKMLSEILEARILVKDTMSRLKQDSELYNLYNNRQLALKLIANVTYGYTSATYSGRMPNSAIADAIVSCGRETLSKAIREIEQNTQWGAKVVYGDTDSLFVYLPGKTKKDAFRLGKEISQYITSINPAPVKLKFEKVYFPCVLLSKKRYAGYSYEHEDQTTPKFDAKGIETVRRDGVPAQQKIVEKSLRVLFESKDLNRVKQYVNLQFLKIMKNKVNIQDFLFGREVRLGTYKSAASIPPGARISMEKAARDARAEPQYRERVFYLVVKGSRDQLLRDRCMSPEDFLARGNLELDAIYYITKVLIPPLQRIFNLCGVDINSWFDELPRQTFNFNLDQLNFKTPIVNSSRCINCESIIKTAFAKAPKLCPNCSENELATIANMRSSLRLKENQMNDILVTCSQCTKRAMKNNHSPLTTAMACANEDCAIYYDRVKAVKQANELNDRYASYLSW